MPEEPIPPPLFPRRVRVTAQHIEHGVRNDCYRCPVAMALQEVYPECDYVRVVPSQIGLTLRGNYYRIDNSRRVREFIHAFDHPAYGDPRTKPNPFAFTIHLKKHHPQHGYCR